MAVQGGTRAVVTAVLALLGYYGVVLALTLPVLVVLPAAWTQGVVGIGVMSLPVVTAALLINWVLVRRGWTSWRTLGWTVRDGVGLRALGVGVAAGVILALVALLIVVLGGGRIALSGDAVTQYAGRAAVVSGVLCVAALSEELLFRGYPLARLSKATGRVGASVTLAVAFALVHLANPNPTAFGLANIGVASLLFSAAFFTRGGLWAAWGVHFGWNAGLALAGDAPVSGYALELPSLEYVAGPRQWVSGGSFGPEGGVATTVALALGLGAALAMIQRDQKRSDA